MDSRNDRIRDFLGITAWHKAGYTGSRGLSASGEDFITFPFGHAMQTYLTFKEVAPDREVIHLPIGSTVGQLETNQILNISIPTALERKVDTFWASVILSEGGAIYDEAMEAIAPFSTWFFSAGNDSTDRHSKAIYGKYIYGVGACTLMVDGTPVPAGYSSVSEHVDFCAPANWWVDGMMRSGTSFSAPALAGMCALVNDFFLDKTGKPLSSQAMYRFLKDHTVDLSTPGHDNKTGWGIPILPDPDTIDIRRYAGDMMNSRSIDDLRPDVAANCRKMIEIAKRDGYPILVTGTVRDKEYQEYCYYKGTSKSKVPTFHSVEAGLAFDICKNVKGEEYSDNAFWDYCGALGKKLGFTWGGDWKSFVDKPHFQWDDHGKYTGNDILAGRYPPPMPLYKEEEEVTQEQFQAMYDKVNPVYVTLDDVPDYWREETRQLIEKGKLRGDGTGRLNIRHETLRAVIIAER